MSDTESSRRSIIRSFFQITHATFLRFTAVVGGCRRYLWQFLSRLLGRRRGSGGLSFRATRIVVDDWDCPCIGEFERLARLPMKDIEPHFCTPEDDDEVPSERVAARLMDAYDRSDSSNGDEIPTRIGDYTVLEKMGAAPGLFKVRERWTGRILVLQAIKRGDPSNWLDCARDEWFSSLRFRFYLHHDSGPIVPIIDVCDDDAAYHYITMEYLARGSLTQHKAAFSDPAKAVPLVGYLAIVVDGLYRHGYHRGLWHRLILKPDNVLFDDDGKPRLTGFQWNQSESLTASPCGTIAYMSPQQLTGKRDQFFQSDVWALGVILYELVTGQMPFQGAATDDLKKAILQSEPRSPRSLNRKIDKNLNAIIMKCLARGHQQRYDSVASLANDLCYWHRHRSRQQQGFVSRACRLLWSWWK